MFRVLQQRLIVLLLAALLAPAAVATCVAADRCEGTAEGAHACCEMPAIGSCDCGDAHQQGSRPSEPAQRVAPSAPALCASAIADDLIVLPRTSARDLYDSRSPRDTGERLSLLATLVV